MPANDTRRPPRPAGGPRKDRIDAVHNDALILRAARALTLEDGLELRAHAVAERAGVSVGTVKRRFPTRDHLLLGVYSDVAQRLRTLADELRQHPEPFTALADFLREVLAIEESRPGYTEVLGYLTDGEIEVWRAEYLDTCRDLTERAQAAGLVREDFDWREIPFLLRAVGSARGWMLGHRADRAQARRLLEVSIAGLAPCDTQTPLPGAGPHEDLD